MSYPLYPTGNRIYLYLLELTDEGADCAPAYEVSVAMVVRAVNSKHARALASERTIDEPADSWSNRRYSTCRRIGEVTAGASRKPGVICQESNAS